MKYILLLLFTSCASVTPQVGYREARSYEGDSGSQVGIGVRGDVELGPVMIEGSTNAWSDLGSDDEFVNRSTTNIDTDDLQFSLGGYVPIVKGDDWMLTAGLGGAWQRTRTDVDLSYAGSYTDHADAWSAYAELAYRRSAILLAVRYDQELSDVDIFTTNPRGSLAVLAGVSIGF